MTRRPHGTTVRCPRCSLQPSLCLCAELVARASRTKLVLLLLGKEAHKPTNTGRLAALLLAGAEVRVRPTRSPGDGPAPSIRDLLDDPARRPLLLCATASRVLDRALVEEDPRPVTLLAVDGTWREARRFSTRDAELRGVPRVRLEGGAPTRYRLRSPQGGDRLSTLEAIARALEVLEGPELREHLESAFEQFVLRTLQARGLRQAVTVEAERHTLVGRGAAGSTT